MHQIQIFFVNLFLRWLGEGDPKKDKTWVENILEKQIKYKLIPLRLRVWTKNNEVN